MQFTVNPLGGTRKTPHKNFPRTLGVFFDTSASSFYRIQVPMLALSVLGYPVGWAHVDQIPNEITALYDLIIGIRTGNGDPEMIRESIEELKTQPGRTGKRIRLVLDYDDDVLNIPEHNPAYGLNKDGIRMAMRLADGLTVTNDRLAHTLREINPNVCVIPNMVAPLLWSPNKLSSVDKVTVGVVGSDSHGKDWKLIAEPMQRIKQTYGDKVHFLVGGFLPSYFESIADEYIPWVPIEQYPSIVNSIDIGLCPLIDDHFNRCKSPIKAYEYALGGAAVVGSPTQYRTTLQGRGVIATTADEWYQGIANYIDNEKLRREHSAKLQEFVKTSMNAMKLMEKRYAKTYQDFYKTLCKLA